MYTDADGRYVIHELRDGAYTIEVSDPAGRYQAGTLTDPGTSTPAVVTVTGGQQHTGADVRSRVPDASSAPSMTTKLAPSLPSRSTRSTQTATPPDSATPTKMAAT